MTATPTPGSPATIAGAISLDQKIGQTMVIGFDGLRMDDGLREMIVQRHIGGVILFARNVESPQQVADLCAELQRTALESGNPGLFIAIDQEGGRVARLTEATGFTEFPGAMAVAAGGSTQNARLVAQAMAREMAAVGINVDFAPDLDVNNNPLNPVIGVRSYGSQPDMVGIYGSAVIDGLQSEGVLAFGKHFPGHGDTAIDSHVSLPAVPHARGRLDAVELVPFRAAIEAGAAGIMSAHVTFPAIDPEPGRPATLSSRVLTDLMRAEMGYSGLVVTDSLEMGALGEAGYPVPLAAANALQAGADLLLFNRDHELHRQAFDQLSQWLAEGKIPATRLDEAVARILDAKKRFGLLNPDLNYDTGQVGLAETRALSHQVAVQSITLLRDQAGLLPLQKAERYLVVEVPGAAGLGRALGLTYLAVKEKPGDREIQQAVDMARDGRTVIVATTDANRVPAQIELVRRLSAAGNPVIWIAMRNPYDLMAYPQAQTYLASYGANPPALEALAAVLWGQADPQGKLPVELPGLYLPGAGLNQFENQR